MHARKKSNHIHLKSDEIHNESPAISPHMPRGAQAGGCFWSVWACGERWWVTHYAASFLKNINEKNTSAGKEREKLILWKTKGHARIHRQELHQIPLEIFQWCLFFLAIHIESPTTSAHMWGEERWQDGGAFLEHRFAPFWSSWGEIFFKVQTLISEI